MTEPSVVQHQGRVKVILPIEYIRYGALRGIERQLDNLEHERQEKHGHGAYLDWQTHINGALGELAVAVALGKEWDGNVGDLDAMDVGNYQVRTSHGVRGDRHKRRLILHPGDWIGDVFIHVTGLNGYYILQGWIYGSDGLQSDYWLDVGTGRPAYFVPNGLLKPMYDLPEETEGRV